jgi:hypothetical protein
MTEVKGEVLYTTVTRHSTRMLDNKVHNGVKKLSKKL